MENQRVKIRLRAFDHKVLDHSVHEIVSTAKRTGAQVVGPVPIPNRIERFTVLRSPHIDKKSREQFEMRTHTRIVYIFDWTSSTMDALMGVDLPSGVEVDIKI
jgi:small subunit ribosomal protein S10